MESTYRFDCRLTYEENEALAWGAERLGIDKTAYFKLLLRAGERGLGGGAAIALTRGEAEALARGVNSLAAGLDEVCRAVASAAENGAAADRETSDRLAEAVRLCGRIERELVPKADRIVSLGVAV